MAVTWITPVDITGTSTGFVDRDVSAYCPAGTTGIIVQVKVAANYENLGARCNGSTDNRVRYHYKSNQWILVGVDANRIAEISLSNTTNQKIALVGYFGSESVFNVNAVDKSLSATGAWTDIDISGDTTGTSIIAFFEVNKTNDTGYAYGFRKNGSTDARVGNIRTYDSKKWVSIGVDANEILEGYTANAAVDFYLQGYATTGFTVNTNAPNLSLSSTGSWIDLTALTAGATGGFFEINAGYDGCTYGLRKNGSAADLYDEPSEHCWGASECDASRIVEGRISDTTIDFFEIAVSLAAAGGPYTESRSGVLTSSGSQSRSLILNRTKTGTL